MQPKTLSASSLETFGLCPKRWVAENLHFTPQEDSLPAMVGTACHGAFEPFVRAVYIDKIHEWDWDRLLAYYQMSYIETFASGDFDTDSYRDGLEMVTRWFIRTDLTDVEIIEVEKKKRFELKINAEISIPITYIFDRLERMKNGKYRVVDYKSIRQYIPAPELKKKIQPRIYALAVQLEHPEVDGVWVEFDMLRHEPIGVYFTKEENLATYRYLQREAVRILNMTEDDAPETLNKVCGYCVRKSECKTLVKHAAGGGLLGLSPVEIARKKAEVAYALKGLKILEESLDELLINEGRDQDAFSFELQDPSTEETLTVEITAKKQRSANADAIRTIIGPELTSKYGNITMTAVDKMLKSQDLTDEQKKEVKSMISASFGKESATVTLPNPLESL